MSIILDALRKSEAARRRNEAPELFASMPNPAEPAHKSGAWPRWALGAFGAVGIVGVASLALALWLILTKDATQGDAAVARTAENASVTASTHSATPVDMPAAGRSQPPGFATASSPTSATSEITAPEIPASEILAPATDLNAARDTANTLNASAIAPSNTPAPNAATTPNATRIASAAPAAPPRMPPAPASGPLLSAQSVSAPAMPAPIETAPRSTAPAAFRSPQSDAPLAVADLDAGARQQLPPLKLSMHVWNEAPAQRFVILDGQRLREGDVIGEVVVERITRDGAQLSWRGTALKLEWR